MYPLLFTQFTNWPEANAIDTIPADMSGSAHHKLVSSLSLLHNEPLGSFCPRIRSSEEISQQETGRQRYVSPLDSSL